MDSDEYREYTKAVIHLYEKMRCGEIISNTVFPILSLLFNRFKKVIIWNLINLLLLYTVIMMNV